MYVHTAPVCGVPELTPVFRCSASTARPCHSARGPRPTQAHGIVRNGTDTATRKAGFAWLGRGQLRLVAQEFSGTPPRHPIGCRTLCPMQLSRSGPTVGRWQSPSRPDSRDQSSAFLAQAPTNALLFPHSNSHSSLLTSQLTAAKPTSCESIPRTGNPKPIPKELRHGVRVVRSTAVAPRPTPWLLRVGSSFL